MTPCKHCTTRRATKPRGLCVRCYESPARDLYPVSARAAKAALSLRATLRSNNAIAPTPETPTDAAPGSEAKLKVMIERFARGESLWHPQDAKINER